MKLDHAQPMGHTLDTGYMNVVERSGTFFYGNGGQVLPC